MSNVLAQSGPESVHGGEDTSPIFHDPNAPNDDGLASQPHAGVLDDDPPLEEELEKSPIWLVTFGDVTALMLAFFVMLYSMSNPQSEKWDAVISILATRDDPVVHGSPHPVGRRTTTRIDLVKAFPTGYLRRILEEKLGADPLLTLIRLSGLDGKLVLSLSADRIFEGDGAALSEIGRQTIARLTVVFGQFGNRVDIQGHTDPLPLPAGGYSDKWELSLARALAVARALKANGLAGNVTAMGLADTGYEHIDPAIPESQRLDLARRVDIVILPEARGQ